MAAQPGQIIRQTHKHIVFRLASAAALSTVFFTIAITAVILHTRQAVPQITEPPRTFLPGEPLPVGTRCMWPPRGQWREVTSCSTTLGDMVIHMAFDTNRQIVTRTSVQIDRQMIGTMVLAWGIPTGIRRTVRSAEMQWGMRSVYVSTSPLQPSNATSFVFYSLEQEPASTWAGFASRR
jgi:hypothetical protein